MSIKDFIAERWFAEQLDESYAMGNREGYRIGSNEVKRHYYEFVRNRIQALHDSADAKHQHGLGVALAFLDALEHERKDNIIRAEA
ncbi:MAG: hypothetical protein EBS38_05575 [Actinobacteria bacterium]|nr:hypothetical protein [Actinomycetota bacterium]